MTIPIKWLLQRQPGGVFSTEPRQTSPERVFGAENFTLLGEAKSCKRDEFLDILDCFVSIHRNKRCFIKKIYTVYIYKNIYIHNIHILKENDHVEPILGGF